MADEITIRNMIVLEGDRVKEKTISGEKWKLKAIFPRERREIARAIAIAQNGLPSNSFNMDDQYAFRRDATVDACIESAPDWWKGPLECIDESLLDTLYDEIEKWTTDFQEKLKKNKFAKRDTKK